MCAVTAMSIGVAIANLAKANVIGGICIIANLMKMKAAPQNNTMMPAIAPATSVLFVVAYLPVAFTKCLFARFDLNDENVYRNCV